MRGTISGCGLADSPPHPLALLATSPHKRGEVNDSPALSHRPQRICETLYLTIIRRQAEAQEIVGPLEATAPDVFCGERSVYLPGIGAAREPEQSAAARDRESGAGQNIIQPARLGLNRNTRAIGPSPVAQCGGADGQGRS